MDAASPETGTIPPAIPDLPYRQCAFRLYEGRTGALGFHSYENANIAALWDIEHKLRTFYEGECLTLIGSAQGNDFTASMIFEGGVKLGDDDYTMFCASMEIPFAN